MIQAIRWPDMLTTGVWLKKGLILFFIGTVFISLLTIAQSDLTVNRGADFWKYLNWANAFEYRDVDRLRDSESTTLSPVGVPYSQWSFGTGLIFQPGKKLSNSPENGNDVKIVAWVWAMIFWWAMAHLLHYASREYIPFTLFGLFITFLGTHAGFYSFAYSSETLAHCSLAAMGCFVFRSKKIRLFEMAVIGVLSAFLIIIRVQLIIYWLPIYGMLFYLCFVNGADRTHGMKILKASVVIIPIGISLFQILLTNYWMNGHPLKSTYVFGEQAFHSVDISAPEFTAVLIHPLNGLLTHHPLYLIGIVVVFLMAAESPTTLKMLFFLCIGFILLAHLYLQAAWYVWWLGMLTFGMRGLGIWSVVLVPLLIRYLSDRRTRNRSTVLWIGAATAASTWSFLCILEGYRHSFTYKNLLFHKLAVVASIWSQDFFTYLAVLLISAGLIRFAIKYRPAGQLYLLLSILFYMVIYSLIFYVEKSDGFFPRLMNGPIQRSIIVLMVPALIMGALGMKSNSMAFSLLRHLIGCFFILSFIYAAFSFYGLGSSIQERIETGSLLTLERVTNYEFLSRYQLDTILLSYREYRYIAGFEEKKRRMNSFLQGMEGEGRRAMKRLVQHLQEGSTDTKEDVGNSGGKAAMLCGL